MDKEVTRSQINLPPGFRFCPTDEELMVHYLCKKAASQPFAVPVIAEVGLYKYDPWDLPGKALFGDKEWYFFSQRDRKYPNGSRPNRAAASGYWKATGTDKSITSGGDRKIGVKKSLVFYKGRTPKGEKTNWIMHEYCLADSTSRAARTKGSSRMDDWVLCRIYEKLSGAQKDAMAKECRPESSWEEDVLASQPEIGDSKLLSNLPRPKFSNRMSSLKSAVPYDRGPIPRTVQISHAAVNFSDACGGGRQVNYDPPSPNSTNYHTLPTHKERCHNGSIGADPAIIVTEVGSESAYVGPRAPHLVQMGSRVERPWMSTGTVAEEVFQIRDYQMLFELQRASLGDDGVLFASRNQMGTRLKE